jgi:cob(I)alamin adenosyltransferase
MTLYTGKGDEGKSKVWGKKISKSSPKVNALGQLDELNSHLGLCRSTAKDEQIKELLLNIQNSIHWILAEVSGAPNIAPFPLEKTDHLEKRVNEFEKEIGPIKSFVVPGGSVLSAQFDITRTVCRRAERALREIAEAKEISEAITTYMNRLSSLLFALARTVNKRNNIREIKPTY